MDSERLQIEQFKKATREKLRDLRCPEHNRAPYVIFHGTKLRDIRVSLKGCCSEMMRIANVRIAIPAQPE